MYVFYTMQIQTVSRKLQPLDTFLLQEILHYLASMTRSTIMQENIAVMDSHVELKLALQQINIFFTIHGGSRCQKVKSSCAPEGHGFPYHLTRGMFTVGVVYFSS